MPETRNWRFSLDFEGVGWLTIDTPEAPVNTLSRETIVELETLVSRFEDLIASGELTGIVMLSGKDSGFIAGADISEFDEMAEPALLTDALKRTHALFERIEYPALFHCKSGADRAGLMSALYLIMKAGRPVAEAKEMLSLRYGHVRQSKTGVLDAFLDAFEAAQQAAAAEGRRLEFMEWVETDYDPRALNDAFRTKRWADWLIDDVLGRE